MKPFSITISSLISISILCSVCGAAQPSIESLESLKARIPSSSGKAASSADRASILKAIRMKRPSKITKADRDFVEQDMAAHPGDYVHPRTISMKPAAQREAAGKQPAKPKPYGLAHMYDRQKAGTLAAIANENHAGDFGGACYAYVAGFMEQAGIIQPSQWGDLGIGPVSAADFLDWASANPDALYSELHLERMPTPPSGDSIPIGSILVYDRAVDGESRGACGFNRKHGHIEVLVSPDYLCSDGCEGFKDNCLDSYPDRIGVFVPVQ